MSQYPHHASKLRLIRGVGRSEFLAPGHPADAFSAVHVDVVDDISFNLDPDPDTPKEALLGLIRAGLIVPGRDSCGALKWRLPPGVEEAYRRWHEAETAAEKAVDFKPKIDGPYPAEGAVH